MRITSGHTTIQRTWCGLPATWTAEFNGETIWVYCSTDKYGKELVVKFRHVAGNYLLPTNYQPYEAGGSYINFLQDAYAARNALLSAASLEHFA